MRCGGCSLSLPVLAEARRDREQRKSALMNSGPREQLLRRRPLDFAGMAAASRGASDRTSPSRSG